MDEDGESRSSGNGYQKGLINQVNVGKDKERVWVGQREGNANKHGEAERCRGGGNGVRKETSEEKWV